MSPERSGPLEVEGVAVNHTTAVHAKEEVRVNTVCPYPSRRSTIARFLAEVRNAEAQNYPCHFVPNDILTLHVAHSGCSHIFVYIGER